jgi:hypothetical protein
MDIPNFVGMRHNFIEKNTVNILLGKKWRIHTTALAWAFEIRSLKAAAILEKYLIDYN